MRVRAKTIPELLASGWSMCGKFYLHTNSDENTIIPEMFPYLGKEFSVEIVGEGHSKYRRVGDPERLGWSELMLAPIRPKRNLPDWF